MSLKNPVTPPGMDPGTVRLLAQRLNHYATQGSDLINTAAEIFQQTTVINRAWGSVVVKALRY